MKTVADRIKPLNDYICVRPLEKPTETEGGILLPDQSQEEERPERGIVVSVGPGTLGKVGDELRRIPVKGIAPGMEVIFGRYNAGITIDDEMFKMVKLEELFGVLEPAE